MKKSEKVALVHSRAFQYARSGKYPNWYSIELKLRKEGFPEARAELDDRVLRAELNQICRGHRAETEV